MSPELVFSVPEFIDICNQSLEYAYSSVVIEGEVASFKINQKKWVFFDLKEADYTLNCFMSIYQLNMPVADGMKVRVRALPRLTRWGKFSLTVQQVQPIGKGNIKKSFELLRQKLSQEGLFDPLRKRPLPENLSTIGVISSTDSAGYVDFIKILNERWGGLRVYTAHTQVQGMDAATQIIRALEYFNQQGRVDLIAVIRGGGSADDLATFNDEQLVRAISASRIPIITGIGHEIDESLADLAADLRASTPSNAAERIVPDRRETAKNPHSRLEQISRQISLQLERQKSQISETVDYLTRQFLEKIHATDEGIASKIQLLDSFNPDNILRRGYAVLAGKLEPNSEISITTHENIIKARITHVKPRF